MNRLNPADVSRWERSHAANTQVGSTDERPPSAQIVRTAAQARQRLFDQERHRGQWTNGPHEIVDLGRRELRFLHSA
jgi:hypothetical protein